MIGGTRGATVIFSFWNEVEDELHVEAREGDDARAAAQGGQQQHVEAVDVEHGEDAQERVPGPGHTHQG